MTASDTPSADKKNGLRRQLGRLLTELGTARLIATILLLVAALALARLSWNAPLLGDAERVLYDSRAAAMAPRVEQDSRILVVAYFDETLFKTGIRSPVDRTMLTRALANLDRMGAKAIGIDIGFDTPRPEDPALQAQLRAMNTPTWLAYVTQDTNRNTIQWEQQQYLEQFIAAARSAKTGPASVRFVTDGDGVKRRWPDRPAGLPPLLANAMAPVDAAHRSFSGGIRYHLPLRATEGQEEAVFTTLPIDIFGELLDDDTLAALGSQVAGRYVLIGGNIIGDDLFETPLSSVPDLVTGERKMMYGVHVHAHMLRQQLDADWPRPLSASALWTIALLVVVAGGLTSLIDARTSIVTLALLGQLAALLALPFWMQGNGVDTLDLPAFGWALGWLVAYAATGSASRTVGAKQRAFAQSALGKYLPRDVAAEILRDPESLALSGEKREIFCIFTDLEGFTKLSHAVTPETVARLLNNYLDRLSDVVLEHGGTIDKFVGDAVVAFWGAPLSRPDDGERAAKAALAMYQEGEAFRRDMAEGVPPIGMTRVGLHVGDAIVGNFGGEDRIQYTALGDSMNTASRLEAANKALHNNILISAEAAARSGRDDLIPMGRITLRGRSQPVDVFTPRPDLDPAARARVAAAVAAHAEGNKSLLVTHATALRAEFGQDTAILFLLDRLDQTAQGESYVLS